MSTPQPVETYGLGAQVMQFRPRSEMLAAVTFILLGLFCAVGGLFAVLSRAMPDPSFGWILLGGGSLIVIGIAFYLYNLRKQPIVTVFQEGVTQGRKSETPTVIRWDELDDFRIKVLQKVFLTPVSFHMRGKSSVTLRAKDGSTISIKEQYPNMGALVDLLWRMNASTQAPASLEAFEQGKTLTFGPLSISKLGVHKDGNTLAWPEVHSIGILGGSVVVRTTANNRTKDWTRVRVEDIPNLPVLTAIIASPQINKLQGNINLARLAFGL